MPTKDFASEAELAAHVCAWLESEGWDVYKEVFCSTGDIDIVAVRAGIVWVIETKLSFNVDVVHQATCRTGFGHYVSVATPPLSYERRYRGGTILLRDVMAQRGIGWLAVERYTPTKVRVWQEVKPRFVRLKGLPIDRLRAIREIKDRLTEHHKGLVAGAPGGGQITAFKLTIIRVEEFLRKHGSATMAEIVEKVQHHYSTTTGAKTCIAKAMGSFPGIREKFRRDGIGPSARWSLR